MNASILFEQKLLGTALFTPKDLSERVGRTPATLIQQLHHYLRGSDFEHQGKKWVCMTREQWGIILRCHAKTIGRAFQKLESLGLVIGERLHARRYTQKKSYTIDYQRLETFLSEETKCSDQPRQNVPDEGDILSLSNNKSFFKNSKKQQTKRSKVQNLQTELPHQPHPVPEVKKKEIVAAADTDGKGLQISIADASSPENGAAGLPPAAPPDESLPVLDGVVETDIVETVGHKLSASFKRFLAKSCHDVVKDALTLVKTGKNINNKAGFLRRAIEQEWKPSGAIAEPEFTLDPDFDEWWRYAHQQGIAMGSERKGDQLWIYDQQARAIPYQQMREKHSLAKLQSKAQPQTPASPQPVDLSDVLAQIKLHFARLRWDAASIQSFLKETYGKAKQDFLDDAQLFDLNARLQGL